ncbi:MAG: hypothetical protein SVM80_06845 [Halobacteriota archaeon]|nr:hypothetical protein [Halobacteriota archaeon]
MKKSYKKMMSALLVTLMMLSIVGTAVAEPIKTRKMNFAEVVKGDTSIMNQIRERRNNLSINQADNINLAGGKDNIINQANKNTISNTISSRRVVRPVYSAQGFALNDDEFHVVKVYVIGVKRPHPLQVRNLLNENISISDISEQMQNRAFETYYIGRMKFGEDYYILRITELDKNYLKADIVSIPPRISASTLTPEALESSEVVGTISLRVYAYEGSIVCDGTTEIGGNEFRTLMNLLTPQFVKNNGNVNLEINEATA